MLGVVSEEISSMAALILRKGCDKILVLASGIVLFLVYDDDVLLELVDGIAGLLILQILIRGDALVGDAL